MPYLLLALAFAPGIALAVFIYCKDKFEKEPLSLLVQCFFAGAVSVLPAILLTLGAEKFGPGMSQNKLSVAIHAFFVIGLSEEWSKYIFLRWTAYPRKDFNEPFDGIVYSAMIAMGFATVENILYILKGGLGVLASAAGFHGAYDFCLLQESYALLTFGAVVSLCASVYLSFKAMKSSQKLSPFRAA